MKSGNETDGAMPPPSAELVLVRVALEAHLKTIGRKRGERFLACMADTLATEESLAQVLRVRPSSDEPALAEARKRAMLWFRQILPVLMARLQ